MCMDKITDTYVCPSFPLLSNRIVYFNFRFEKYMMYTFCYKNMLKSDFQKQNY